MTNITTAFHTHPLVNADFMRLQPSEFNIAISALPFMCEVDTSLHATHGLITYNTPDNMQLTMRNCGVRSKRVAYNTKGNYYIHRKVYKFYIAYAAVNPNHIDQLAAAIQRIALWPSHQPQI